LAAAASVSKEAGRDVRENAMVLKGPAAVAALLAAAAASGCAGVRQAVGVEKVAPDEFRVVTSAPLTMPPDFQLRPPRPGDPRPQELRPDDQARAAVFGQDIGQAASPGERNLVAAAGAEAVDPAIRAQVDLEAGGVVRKSEPFADRVLEGGEAKTEEERLKEEETVRRATGGEGVIIQKRETKSKLPGL
jgi:hypothetical protein